MEVITRDTVDFKVFSKKSGAGGYSRIPQFMKKCSFFSSNQIRVMATLIDYQEKYDEIKASYRKIGDDSGLNRRQVEFAIRGLEDAGILVSEHRHNYFHPFKTYKIVDIFNKEYLIELDSITKQEKQKSKMKKTTAGNHSGINSSIISCVKQKSKTQVENEIANINQQFSNDDAANKPDVFFGLEPHNNVIGTHNNVIGTHNNVRTYILTPNDINSSSNSKKTSQTMSFAHQENTANQFGLVNDNTSMISAGSYAPSLNSLFRNIPISEKNAKKNLESACALDLSNEFESDFDECDYDHDAYMEATYNDWVSEMESWDCEGGDDVSWLSEDTGSGLVATGNESSMEAKSGGFVAKLTKEAEYAVIEVGEHRSMGAKWCEQHKRCGCMHSEVPKGYEGYPLIWGRSGYWMITLPTDPFYLFDPLCPNNGADPKGVSELLALVSVDKSVGIVEKRVSNQVDKPRLHQGSTEIPPKINQAEVKAKAVGLAEKLEKKISPVPKPMKSKSSGKGGLESKDPEESSPDEMLAFDKRRFAKPKKEKSDLFERAREKQRLRAKAKREEVKEQKKETRGRKSKKEKDITEVYQNCRKILNYFKYYCPVQMNFRDKKLIEAFMFRHGYGVDATSNYMNFVCSHWDVLCEDDRYKDQLEDGPLINVVFCDWRADKWVVKFERNDPNLKNKDVKNIREAQKNKNGF